MLALARWRGTCERRVRIGGSVEVHRWFYCLTFASRACLHPPVSHLPSPTLYVLSNPASLHHSRLLPTPTPPSPSPRAWAWPRSARTFSVFRLSHARCRACATAHTVDFILSLGEIDATIAVLCTVAPSSEPFLLFLLLAFVAIITLHCTCCYIFVLVLLCCGSGATQKLLCAFDVNFRLCWHVRDY